MNDERTWKAQIAWIEEGSDPERARGCDRIVVPEEPAPRGRLVEALLTGLLRGGAPGKTAALRALRRAWFPGMPGVQEVTACALATDDALVRGAAVDVLGVMLHEEHARRTIRGTMASAISRAVPLCLDLGAALCELDGPLLDDELALFEALHLRLREEENAALRRDTAEALGALGPRASAAVPALLEAAVSWPLEVALAALRALLLVAPGGPEVATAAAWLLARRERDAVRLTLEILTERLREAPATPGSPPVPPASLRPLLAPFWPPSIQQAACGLLGEVGETQDIDLLLAFLASTLPPGHLAAWEALVSLARRGVLPPERAFSLRHGPVPLERALGLTLLASFSLDLPRAREELMRTALHERDQLLRDGAVALLRERPSDEERRFLAGRLAPAVPATERRRAMVVLTHLRPLPEQIPLLLGALRGSDAVLRGEACRALGRLDPREASNALAPAYPLLLRSLADPEVASCSREALLALRPEPPAGFPLDRLLATPPDWEGARRDVFDRTPPGGEALWLELLAQRIRWTERLLGRPHSHLPDQVGPRVEVLLGLGAKRTAKRNHSREERGDAALGRRELAWLLAEAWKQGHKAEGRGHLGDEEVLLGSPP